MCECRVKPLLVDDAPKECGGIILFDNINLLFT